MYALLYLVSIFISVIVFVYVGAIFLGIIRGMYDSASSWFVRMQEKFKK